MTSRSTLKLDNASVRLTGTYVLRDCSLELAAGECAAIRGTNGSGKTTLLRLITGAIPPTEGTRIGPQSAAYVPAAVTPPKLRAREWVKRFPRPGRRDPFQALEALTFKGNLDASCRQLSFGNLRKLLLAEALSSTEQLVAIDEATAGLDDTGISGLRTLCTTAASHGAVVVTADQQGARPLSTKKTIRLENGATHDENNPSSTSRIELIGPQERQTELLAAARRVGYQQTK